MEVREYLAEMGFRNFNEIVGRADLLEKNDSVLHWKTKNVDLSDLTASCPLPKEMHFTVPNLRNTKLMRCWIGI